MTRYALVAFVMCAACGSSSSSSVDAPGKKDGAGGSSVVAVSCTGITPAVTVTPATTGDSYSPDTATIMQGQVVMFMTTTTHDVFPGHHVPDSTITDPGIHVDFSMTGCRMFTQTGSYGFHCSMHGFDGTITVN